MDLDTWLSIYEPEIKFLEAIKLYIKNTPEKIKRNMRRREVFVRSRSKWYSKNKK